MMDQKQYEKVVSIATKLREYVNIQGGLNRPIEPFVVIIRTRLRELKLCDYPYQSDIIIRAERIMVTKREDNTVWLNPVAVGQILACLDIIIEEEAIPAAWNCVHPQIQQVSRRLYTDKYYANAVMDAFIEVCDRVKHIYIQEHPGEQRIPDGVELMHKAFGGENSIILGEPGTRTGQDIQEGYRFLFAGSMAAFRNQKAHENNVVISRKEAMRRIMVASSLMYKLDETGY